MTDKISPPENDEQRLARMLDSGNTDQVLDAFFELRSMRMMNPEQYKQVAHSVDKLEKTGQGVDLDFSIEITDPRNAQGKLVSDNEKSKITGLLTDIEFVLPEERTPSDTKHGGTLIPNLNAKEYSLDTPEGRWEIARQKIEASYGLGKDAKRTPLARDNNLGAAESKEIASWISSNWDKFGNRLYHLHPSINDTDVARVFRNMEFDDGTKLTQFDMVMLNKTLTNYRNIANMNSWFLKDSDITKGDLRELKKAE